MSFWIEILRASAQFPHPLSSLSQLPAKFQKAAALLSWVSGKKLDKSKNPIHPPAAKQPEHNTLYFQALQLGCLLFTTLPSMSYLVRSQVGGKEVERENNWPKLTQMLSPTIDWDSSSGGLILEPKTLICCANLPMYPDAWIIWHCVQVEAWMLTRVHFKMRSIMNQTN